MPSNLRFDEIIIRDFQSFVGEHTLSFTKAGLVYVTGKNLVDQKLTSNGVGKSTIFNALTWCLYGRTLENARPGDNVVPWYGDNDSPNVQVCFTRAGVKYVLDRGRKPNILILNDETVTQDTVTAAIGLSYEAFINCVVLGQFGDLFLSLKPEEQTALFTELLNLDVWISSAENASKKLKATETRLESMRGSHTRLEGQNQECIANIETVQQSADAWKIDHRIRVEALQRAVEDAQVEYNALQKAPPSAADTREDEAAVLDGRKEISALRDALKVYKTNREDTRAKQAKANAAIAIGKQQLQKYDTAESTCPECGQIVDRTHIIKKKNEIGEEISINIGIEINLDKDITKLDKEIMRCEDEIGEIETLVEQVRERIVEANKEMVTYEHKLNILKLKRDSTIQDATYAQKEQNPYAEALINNQSRAHKLKTSIDEMEQAIKGLEADAYNLKFWYDSFKQIRLNLIDETLVELEFAVMRHANALGMDGWRISFETERETAKGEVRSKFTTLLYAPHLDEAVPLTNTSGGERQRWQLACALGLSDVLLHRAGMACNLLVLDEPTRHMSEEGVEDLIGCLSSMAEDKTVFFIDHHHIDNGNFGRTLTVTKTDQGSSLEWTT